MPLQPVPSRLATGGGLFVLGVGLTALAIVLTPRLDAAGPPTPALPAAAAPASPAAAAAPAARTPSMRTSYADVLEPAMRAVVNIQATRRTGVSRRHVPEIPGFFPWQLPPQHPGPDEFENESAGSGVVVRGDGIILTNNHVVTGADTVTVTLQDKRELRAKVFGTDPATDIAVLKVEDGQMASIPFGESADLRVGDVVLAIGSPFGLAQTATMGIVSATGRGGLGITRSSNGRDAGYENFIQTDAAINPGNSGGALIDSNGRLIGINTAIYSRGAAGSQGVGFAVPVDLARSVMNQILSEGRVVRARLGVAIQPVDAAIAKSYGLARPEGALVVAVTGGSPADRAGLKADDVIVELDGQHVESDASLRLDISSRKPGTRVAVGVLRDADGRMQRLSLPATLEELTDDDASEADEVAVADEGSALRGIQVGDAAALTNRERAERGLEAPVTGALVLDVEAGSPAARAGLRPGSVIVQLDKAPVASKADFVRLAKEAGEEIVRVKFRRGRTMGVVALEP